MGSSSHVLSALFRVRFRPRPVVHADIHDASLEVLLSITTSDCRVHVLVHPKHPTFRSQCSSHSQRFPPRRPFWTYFIPKPRMRFAFQGVSPLSASTARRCFVPSAYSPRPPALGKPSAPVLVAARSRFCSEKRSVTPTGGFSADAVRSPLRLFTSPGSSSTTSTAIPRSLRSCPWRVRPQCRLTR